MPKETFLKLPQEKQNRFIEAALEEFASHDFQTASISQVVKKLRIAKGSVYQYFNDKLDLWLYLKQYSEQIKLGYIRSLRREDYPDFWDYYRAMYAKGLNFDLENPLCSLFLYRIGFKESSPQLLPYLNSWKVQAQQMFAALIEAEKESGAFNKELNTQIGAHFMVSMSMSIAELMQNHHQVDFERNIAEGKPLFAQNATELMLAVEELISLLEKALK